MGKPHEVPRRLRSKRATAAISGPPSRCGGRRRWAYGSFGLEPLARSISLGRAQGRHHVLARGAEPAASHSPPPCGPSAHRDGGGRLYPTRKSDDRVGAAAHAHRAAHAVLWKSPRGSDGAHHPGPERGLQGRPPERTAGGGDDPALPGHHRAQTHARQGDAGRADQQVPAAGPLGCRPHQHPGAHGHGAGLGQPQLARSRGRPP